MEMFADIVRIKMSFLCMSWAQLGNYITIICLKANLLCSGLLFISPQSGKEKKPICWRLTIHYHRLTEKKILVGNSHAVWSCGREFICALCLAEWGRTGNLVLFVSCAIPLHVVSVGWLLVHRGPPQPAETAMCQFYYAYCCLSQWGKAALLLSFTLILLPTKFVSGVHHLSLCSPSFSCSASLSASPSLTLSLVFFFVFLACVSISASVSCFEWVLMVTGTLV